jgi:hypothetical protein
MGTTLVELCCDKPLACGLPPSLSCYAKVTQDEKRPGIGGREYFAVNFETGETKSLNRNPLPVVCE